MSVLCFAMQKGGVAKTTSTLAVGVELAKLGAQVLLIDMDPQSNLTQALRYDPTELSHSVYEVLLNPTHGTDFATIRTTHGVDLIPATLALAGAELALAGRFGRELLLRTALAETRRAYDYYSDRKVSGHFSGSLVYCAHEQTTHYPERQRSHDP